MKSEKKKVPTVSAGLDKRRKLTDDLYNASLIVAFQHKRKYYHLTDGGGTKVRLKPKDLRTRETKEFFFQAIERAKSVIRSMPAFNWDMFEKRYFSDQFDESSDLVKALRKYALSLPDSRLKTKIGYETVANVVEEYSEGKRIEMHEITVDWLNKFEAFLKTPYMKQTKYRSILKKGRSGTTVGIYLRNIRAVIIQWVNTEKPQNYALPFGPGLYQIPTGTNTKKALSFEDIAKIYHYELPEGSKPDFYRDLWLFSYMANGMNLKDVARLKFKNIDRDVIKFFRAKTIATRKANQQEVVIPITIELGRILDKWKAPGGKDDFVFPILRPGMTARQELNKIQIIISQINKEVREIASQLGITQDVSTYAARHSFATEAMRKGFSVTQISKALGHTSTAITENYLGSFESKQIREMAEKLQDFQKYRPK